MNGNLRMQVQDGGNFEPHPEGIHPAVCVDVMDLGMVDGEFGPKPKVKLVFETEAKTAKGTACSVSKSFTASLHPKAKLNEFLGKWRGKPLAIGEDIDLRKVIGACCTLVVSHATSLSGKKYASIDAVSKPTRKLTPSGQYDPAAARQRFEEWKAKQGGQVEGRGPKVESQKPNAAAAVVEDDIPFGEAPAKAEPAAKAGPNTDYDPDVGF